MSPKLQVSNTTRWNPEWSVSVQAAVQHADRMILDPPTAALLAALDRTQSISAAARDVGISYRHAWLLAQTANKHADESLLTTATGGDRGGGTKLTSTGLETLRVYQELQTHLRQAAVNLLPRLLRRAVDQPQVLHVWAAISLQEVLAELLTDFALLRPGVKTRTIYGASNELAEQILAGGEPDLFVSASSVQLDRLTKAGLIANQGRQVVARNGLAVVANSSFKDAVLKPRDLAKFLGQPSALADPSCPLGICTRTFLEKHGLVAALPARMSYAESSRAVVSAVVTGRAKIGIVFLSDLAQHRSLRSLFEIPLQEASSTYEAGILAVSQQTDAKALLEYLGSKSCHAIWSRFGFAAKPQKNASDLKKKVSR